MKTLQRHLIILIGLFLALFGAGFEAKAYTFTLAPGSYGRVKYRIMPAGTYTWGDWSDISISNVTITANAGDLVEIYATKRTGDTYTNYAFTEWTGYTTGLHGPSTFNTFFVMTAGHSGKTITANFTNSYNLSLSVNYSPAGSIAGTAAGVKTVGAQCSVTATANSGYTFLFWTYDNNVVATTATYAFDMPANDYPLVAVFCQNSTSAIGGFYYFDLAAGNVIIRGDKFIGYRYEGSTTPKPIGGTHATSNKYYIYQSQTANSSATGSWYTNTGYYGSAIHLPVYEEIEVTASGARKTWSEYVTNNKDVNQIIDKWNEVAANYNKYPVSNWINIRGNSTFDVVIDGICSNRDGGNHGGSIEVDLNTDGTGGTAYLKLKGDNRLLNLCYRCFTANTSHLYITSNAGDNFTNGSLTLTDFDYDDVPSGIDFPLYPDHTYDRPGKHTDGQTVLGGPDGSPEYGLTIRGGTIFAGCPDEYRGVWPGRNIRYPVCVGGGGNSVGEVTISGGTFTAVSNSPGPAIGGGAGYNSAGQKGLVTISGGHVYAYSNGIYSTEPGFEGFVPTTAIGGSSTFKAAAANESEVTISGNAYVYAESFGGVAIGGGSARANHGGSATVTISNTAEVHAISSSGTRTVYKSVNGQITSSPYTVVSGNALGGGNGLLGGEATVIINNGTIEATSIGGGHAINGIEETATDGGAATITVSGGTTTVTGNIGGGNTNGTGNGGLATIEISGGSLTSGTIGGGSATTGNGGNASIWVKGASTVLDCKSIGGGNITDNAGTPGSVAHDDDPGTGDPIAGIRIENGTVRSGYIGGGTSPNGSKIGKATAKITGGTIQGQFVLSNPSSTVDDHCYFIMEGGIIDNTNLGAVGAATYPRLKPEGGAVYMNDSNGEVLIKETGGSNPTVIRSCTGTNGGAIYMSNGSFTMEGGTIGGVVVGTDTLYRNVAANNGGALYMAGGTFEMKGGNIQYNKATNNDGGGIYIATGGTADIKGGTIHGNQALKGNGGGIYVDPERPRITYIQSSTADISITGNKAKNGGGAYVKSGKRVDLKVISLPYTNNFVGNVATEDGGGIYVTEGTVAAGLRDTINVKNIFFENNIAGRNGGAMCANGSHTEVIIGIEGSGIPTGYFRGNSAQNGGAIYADAKSVDVYTTNIGYYDEEEGEGIGNTATQDGGGIYTAGGEVRIMRAPAIIQYNTAGRNGGGIYANNGTITLYNGNILSNMANCGGGIYANGGNINFTYSSSYSTASEATFINYNTAAVSGGGLYVSSTGTLNMGDDVTLSRNHVPAGAKGGGVYLEGVISIGATSPSARVILVNDNFAAGTIDTNPDDVTIDASNRNNVYLPNPKVSSGHTSVITVVNNGLTTSTRVGFSVPRNYVPVIYCANRTYLQSFLGSKAETGAMYGTVFDDTGKYTIVYGTSSPYHPDYLFLSGGAWVERVTTLAQAGAGFVTSDGGNTVTVSTPEALAYVISYVNGLNDVSQTHTNITIKLANDINIGAFGWTPIAGRNKGNSADLTFTGTFDGQGHTISNLYATHIPKYSGDGQGLFGILGSGAQVKNVCLKEAIVTTGSEASGPLYLGGIAKKTNSGATVSDCVTDVTVESVCTTSVMGGLVGSNGGTIQNCVAIPEMTGYQMGGLVGANSGNIYNSYANPKFTYSGSNKYYGGLVGVNTGTVENCYARVQGTAPATTYFGYLAGNNAGGTLQYSYAPVATYVSSNGTAGTQTGLSTFGVTLATAYNYHVRDNQVAAVNTYAPTYDAHHLADYQLKKYLNKWVDTKNGSSSTYAGWTRPTTQTINDDYPLLKLTSFNAVGATSGDASLNYGDINSHLTSFKNANQAICLYGSKTDVDTNVGIGTAAPLYIDEDAVLTQTGAIQAYVGVTLDNSACHGGANPSWGGITDNIDWHFFSSVLTNAAIGLNYPDAGTVPYGVAPTAATFTSSSQYFSTSFNSYYSDWDLYSYCERDYQWINLKRNSLSHWHEDVDNTGEHYWIYYTNPTEFNPGEGFLMATAEESYLQAYGTLNSHTSNFEKLLSYTEGVSWTGRQGLNLLGNPYQSYFDFNEFATVNSGGEAGKIWTDINNASYIIMDEDAPYRGYVQYAYDQSENPFGANRYLHPHQGFMVVAGKTGLKAVFNNNMRNVTASASFRDGGRINYPLVNLFATDDNGNRDMVTVELGRPVKGGALKLHSLHTGKGSLYCHYEDEDYGIVFTQPGLDEASIRFATDEDCAYTMTWNTQNGEFGYLHLIDNITGMDIDCLTNEEYKFTSKTSDYKSRFRLVFDYTGVEENGEDGPSTGSGTETFAYYADGEIHLTGTPDATARLQIIDMMGRTIVSRDGMHTISTQGLAAGVYVLRLTAKEGTKVQKMVIR